MILVFDMEPSHDVDSVHVHGHFPERNSPIMQWGTRVVTQLGGVTPYHNYSGGRRKP